MSQPKKLTMAAMSLVMVAAMATVMLKTMLPIGGAVGQQKSQEGDVQRVEAATKDFIAAISARDIEAMDKLWAHESYATFMGPLSATIVVGWDSVRKAWEMRFGQFDRVTILLPESHVHLNGNVAWAVGVERVQLLRKNGETLGFDAFATNVFEKHGDRWLVLSHQATPIFREPK
jgi:ketosteroid isomerase-like protein